MYPFLYRLYALSQFIKEFFHFRITPVGAFLLSALAVGAVFGMVRTAYAYVALFTGMLVISLLSGLRFRSSLACERILPAYATLESSFSCTVRIYNKGKKVERGLSYFDGYSTALPTFDEFLRYEEPGESQRNAYDRFFRYYRWLYLVQKKIGVRFDSVAVPDLPPGGMCVLQVRGYPQRRGVVHVHGARIARLDPFGALRFPKYFPLTDAMVVLPKRYRVPHYTLASHRHFQLGGVASAGSVGEQDEAVALREYVPGDPIRHIHWRSSAKKGMLVVKEFQDEFFVRNGLIVDSCADYDRDREFEELLSLATSFVTQASEQDALLDVVLVQDKPQVLTIGRGVGQTGTVLETLACAHLSGGAAWHGLQELAEGHGQTLSSCLCLFLFWDAARENLVQKLVRSGIAIKVLVLVGSDGQEDVPPLGGLVTRVRCDHVEEDLWR